MDDEWLTPEELAKRLRVSRNRVYRLARNKKLNSRKEGNRLFIQYDSAIPLLAPHRSGVLGIISGLINRLHDHPWFVSIAGLSSILGLIIALYALYPRDNVSRHRDSPLPSISQGSLEPSMSEDYGGPVTDIYAAP